MKKLLLIALCCLCLIGCSSNTETPDNQNNDSTNQNNSSINEDSTCSVNKPFKFDDLEITISDKYSFDTIDNEFSEYDNQTVIKLPVTIKNLKDETHSLNMFYYIILYMLFLSIFLLFLLIVIHIDYLFVQY